MTAPRGATTALVNLLLGEAATCVQTASSQVSATGPAIRNRQISRKSLIGLVVVLSLSALLDTIVAMKASVTVDEPTHFKYGAQILKLEPDRLAHGFYDSQVPISALNAAPLVIAAHLEADELLPPLSQQTKLLLIRIATILASLALGLFAYFWAYDLYGESAALASCLLCTLSPNLIAHGTLATTDMYHALGVVGSLYFVRRYLLQPTWRHAVIAGLALALAQIAKSFAIVLYPLVYLAIAFLMLRRTPSRGRGRARFWRTGVGSPSLTPKRVLLFTAIAALCFLAVINVAYSFDRTFQPLSAHHFQSASFVRLQQLPVLGHIPVPVPFPFLQGLVLMKRVDETGATIGRIYLLGELRDPHELAVHGFKSYYAVAYFYKEPIALQILFIWGLVWISRNRKLEDFVAGEGLLLLAAAILVFWLSFFSKTQTGIRYILPALAIETIIAGAAFSNFVAKPWHQKALLAALVLWLAGSVASYYPQMIPYMNEWVHDRRQAYRILSDSNLDWGQEDGMIDEYLRKNPDVVYNPPKLVAGRILVSADNLTGVIRGQPAVELAKRYKPVAMVGYAHFLFDVPAKDIAPGSSTPPSPKAGLVGDPGSLSSPGSQAVPSADSQSSGAPSQSLPRD